MLLVEAATGHELATLEAPEANDIHHLSFSPDASQLAVVYKYGPIQIWNLRLIRSELAGMKLDWDAPAIPVAFKPQIGN